MAWTNDWAKLAREARRKGWIVVQRKNGHWKWISPNGATVWSSNTGVSGAIKAHLREMRKVGWCD